MNNNVGVGNDDLLFGLPSNLEEAIETFLGFYSKAPDFDQITKKNAEDFTVWAHNGSGQFIRNNWYLWWHENHECKEWPKAKPPLIIFFNQLGIYHADDISSIIITAAWHWFNIKQFDLHAEIKRYKTFWKEQGFKDGIYKAK